MSKYQESHLCVESSYYVFFTLVIMGCMQRLNLRGSYGVLPYMSEDLIISVSDATSTLILPFLGGLVLGQLFCGIIIR